MNPFSDHETAPPPVPSFEGKMWTETAQTHTAGAGVAIGVSGGRQRTVSWVGAGIADNIDTQKRPRVTQHHKCRDAVGLRR